MTPNSVNTAYGNALRSLALWLPFIRDKIKEADAEIARLAPPARAAAALSIGEDTTDEPIEETPLAALPVSTSPIDKADEDAVETDDDQQKPTDDWT